MAGSVETQGIRMPISVEIQNLREVVQQMQTAMSAVKGESIGGQKVNKNLREVSRLLDAIEAKTKSAFTIKSDFTSLDKQLNTIEGKLETARDLMMRLKVSDIEMPQSEIDKIEQLQKAMEAAVEKADELKAALKEKAFKTGTFAIDFEKEFGTKQLEANYDKIESLITKRMKSINEKLKKYTAEFHQQQEELITQSERSKKSPNMTAFGALDFLQKAFKTVPKNGEKSEQQEWLSEFMKAQQQDDGSFKFTQFKNGATMNKFWAEFARRFKLSDDTINQIKTYVTEGAKTAKISATEALRRVANDESITLNGEVRIDNKKAIEQGKEAQKALLEEQQLRESQARLSRMSTVTKSLSPESTKITEDSEKELERLKTGLDNVSTAYLNNIRNSNAFTSGMAKAGGAVKQLREASQAGAAQLAQLQQTLGQLDNASNFVNRYLGIYAIVRKVTTAIKNAINNIKELDKTITNIAVVTNMSQEDLWGRIGEYTNRAQQYGVAVKDVYTVSQIFYQQGLQTAQVMDLTTETLKMAKIAGMDYKDAANAMTVAVRAFKIEMSDAQQVTDTYSALAAKFAVSSAELANAMEKTASSAANVGMSLQSTSAFMSVMIQTTRESAQNIGSALKSIIARYGEMKASPDTLINVDGEEAAFNKVDTALKSVGISIKNSAGQFRDFDDVIMELAKKWDTLDNNTQRYIATVMAGNRQQSRFIALVSNYDELNRAMKTANNAENASAAQVAKTLDSLESKINQLKNAWQQLYLSLGIEKFLKGTYEWLTRIITTIGNLGFLKGVIPMLMNIIGLGTGIKNVFKSIKWSINTKQSNLQKTLELNDATAREKLQEFETEAAKPIEKELQLNVKGLEDVQKNLQTDATLAAQQVGNAQTNYTQAKATFAQSGVQFVNSAQGVGLTREQAMHMVTYARQNPNVTTEEAANNSGVDAAKIPQLNDFYAAVQKNAQALAANAEAIKTAERAQLDAEQTLETFNQVIGRVTASTDANATVTEANVMAEENKGIATEQDVNALMSHISKIQKNEATVEELTAAENTETSAIEKEILARLKNAELLGAQPTEIDKGKSHFWYDVGENGKKKLSAKGRSAIMGAASVARIAGTFVAGLGAAIKDTSADSTERSKTVTGIGTAISGVGTGASMGMMFGPWGAALGAVIGAIPGIMQIVDGSYKTALEQYKIISQELETAKQEKQKKDAEATDLSGTIDNLNTLKEAQYESAEAMQNYKDALNSAAELYPSLVEGYDNAGNAIINITSAEEKLAKIRAESAEYSEKIAQLEKQKKNAEIDSLENFLVSTDTLLGGSAYSNSSHTKSGKAWGWAVDSWNWIERQFRPSKSSSGYWETMDYEDYLEEFDEALKQLGYSETAHTIAGITDYNKATEETINTIQEWIRTNTEQLNNDLENLKKNVGLATAQSTLADINATTTNAANTRLSTDLKYSNLVYNMAKRNLGYTDAQMDASISNEQDNTAKEAIEQSAGYYQRWINGMTVTTVEEFEEFLDNIQYYTFDEAKNQLYQFGLSKTAVDATLEQFIEDQNNLRSVLFEEIWGDDQNHIQLSSYSMAGFIKAGITDFKWIEELFDLEGENNLPAEYAQWAASQISTINKQFEQGYFGQGQYYYTNFLNMAQWLSKQNGVAKRDLQSLINDMDISDINSILDTQEKINEYGKTHELVDTTNLDTYFSWLIENFYSSGDSLLTILINSLGERIKSASEVIDKAIQGYSYEEALKDYETLYANKDNKIGFNKAFTIKPDELNKYIPTTDTFQKQLLQKLGEQTITQYQTAMAEAKETLDSYSAATMLEFFDDSLFKPTDYIDIGQFHLSPEVQDAFTKGSDSTLITIEAYRTALIEYYGELLTGIDENLSDEERIQQALDAQRKEYNDNKELIDEGYASLTREILSRISWSNVLAGNVTEADNRMREAAIETYLDYAEQLGYAKEELAAYLQNENLSWQDFLVFVLQGTEGFDPSKIFAQARTSASSYATTAITEILAGPGKVLSDTTQQLVKNNNITNASITNQGQLLIKQSDEVQTSVAALINSAIELFDKIKNNFETITERNNSYIEILNKQAEQSSTLISTLSNGSGLDTAALNNYFTAMGLAIDDYYKQQADGMMAWTGTLENALWTDVFGKTHITDWTKFIGATTTTDNLETIARTFEYRNAYSSYVDGLITLNEQSINLVKGQYDKAVSDITAGGRINVSQMDTRALTTLTANGAGTIEDGMLIISDTVQYAQNAIDLYAQLSTLSSEALYARTGWTTIDLAKNWKAANDAINAYRNAWTGISESLMNLSTDNISTLISEGNLKIEDIDKVFYQIGDHYALSLEKYQEYLINSLGGASAVNSNDNLKKIYNENIQKVQKSIADKFSGISWDKLLEGTTTTFELNEAKTAFEDALAALGKKFDEIVFEQIKKGGQQAIYAIYGNDLGDYFDDETIKTIYEGSSKKLSESLETALSARVGSVVDATTAGILQKAGYTVRQLGTSGNYVIKAFGDLGKAAEEYYRQLQASATATSEELGKAAIEVQRNKLGFGRRGSYKDMVTQETSFEDLITLFYENGYNVQLDANGYINALTDNAGRAIQLANKITYDALGNVKWNADSMAAVAAALGVSDTDLQAMQQNPIIWNEFLEAAKATNDELKNLQVSQLEAIMNAKEGEEVIVNALKSANMLALNTDGSIDKITTLEKAYNNGNGIITRDEYYDYLSQLNNRAEAQFNAVLNVADHWNKVTQDEINELLKYYTDLDYGKNLDGSYYIRNSLKNFGYSDNSKEFIELQKKQRDALNGLNFFDYKTMDSFDQADMQRTIEGLMAESGKTFTGEIKTLLETIANGNIAALKQLYDELGLSLSEEKWREYTKTAIEKQDWYKQIEQSAGLSGAKVGSIIDISKLSGFVPAGAIIQEGLAIVENIEEFNQSVYEYLLSQKQVTGEELANAWKATQVTSIQVKGYNIAKEIGSNLNAVTTDTLAKLVEYYGNTAKGWMSKLTPNADGTYKVTLDQYQELLTEIEQTGVSQIEELVNALENSFASMISGISWNDITLANTDTYKGANIQKSLDDALVFLGKRTNELTGKILYEIIAKGGADAIKQLGDLGLTEYIDEAALKQIYEKGIDKVNNTVNNLLQMHVGSIIDTATGDAMNLNNYHGIVKTSVGYVVKSLSGLWYVAQAAYEQISAAFNEGTASLAEVNKAYATSIIAYQNYGPGGFNKRSLRTGSFGVEMLSAEGKTLEQFGESLAQYGISLSNLIDEYGNVAASAQDWLEYDKQFDKIHIKNFDKFAEAQHLQKNSKEYQDAYNTYVDNTIKELTRSETAMSDFVSKITGSKTGGVFNVSRVWGNISNINIGTYTDGMLTLAAKDMPAFYEALANSGKFTLEETQKLRDAAYELRNLKFPSIDWNGIVSGTINDTMTAWSEAIHELESWAGTNGITIDATAILTAMANKTGTEAIGLITAMGIDSFFTAEQIAGIYRAEIDKLNNAFSQASSISVGALVDDSVALLLNEAGYNFEDIGIEGKKIVSSMGNLSKALWNYYDKLNNNIAATVDEINAAAIQFLNEHNKTTQQRKTENFYDLASNTSLDSILGWVTEFGGEIQNLTETGTFDIQIGEKLIKRADDLIGYLDDGSAYIKNLNNFADMMGIDKTGARYQQLLADYTERVKTNDEALKNLRQSQFEALMNANAGDSVVTTALNQALIDTIQFAKKGDKFALASLINSLALNDTTVQQLQLTEQQRQEYILQLKNQQLEADNAFAAVQDHLTEITYEEYQTISKYFDIGKWDALTQGTKYGTKALSLKTLQALKGQNILDENNLTSILESVTNNINSTLSGLDWTAYAEADSATQAEMERTLSTALKTIGLTNTNAKEIIEAVAAGDIALLEGLYSAAGIVLSKEQKRAYSENILKNKVEKAMKDRNAIDALLDAKLGDIIDVSTLSSTMTRALVMSGAGILDEYGNVIIKNVEALNTMLANNLANQGATNTQQVQAIVNKIEQDTKQYDVVSSIAGNLDKITVDQLQNWMEYFGVGNRGLFGNIKADGTYSINLTTYQQILKTLYGEKIPQEIQNSLNSYISGLYTNINWSGFTTETALGRGTSIQAINTLIETIGIDLGDKTAEQLYEAIKQGGTEAIKALNSIGALDFLDNNTIVSIYQQHINNLNNVASNLAGYSVGQVVDDATAAILNKTTGFKVESKNGIQIITKAANDLTYAARELYIQIVNEFNAGQASLQDVNNAFTLRHNNTQIKQVADILDKAANMTYEEFAEMLTQYGYEAERLLNAGKQQGWLKDNKIGKISIIDAKGFINALGLQKGLNLRNDDLLEVYSNYLDSMVDATTHFVSLQEEQITRLASGRKGEQFNVSLIEDRLKDFKAIATKYGVEIIDGIAYYVENSDIEGFLTALSQIDLTGTELEGQVWIEDALLECAQAVAEAIQNYANLIKDGIGGGLDIAGKNTLQQRFGVTDEDFYKTVDGLALTEQGFAKVYTQMAKIDRLQANNLMVEYIGSLADNKSYYQGIVNIQRHILELERQIADAEAKKDTTKLKQYQAELEVAKEIAHVRALTDSGSFDMYGNMISEAEKSPIIAAENASKYIKDINAGIEEGQMASEAYFDLIDFLIKTNDKGTEGQVSGIEKTLGEIHRISQEARVITEDGEIVDFSKLKDLGVDFVENAEGFKDGALDGVEFIAKGQIEILDAQIAFLEGVVAMENMEDIDLSSVFSGDGLDFSKWFTEGENGIANVTDEFNSMLSELETLAKDSEDARNLLIKIGYTYDETTKTLSKPVDFNYANLFTTFGTMAYYQQAIENYDPKTDGDFIAYLAHQYIAAQEQAQAALDLTKAEEQRSKNFKAYEEAKTKGHVVDLSAGKVAIRINADDGGIDIIDENGNVIANVNDKNELGTYLLQHSAETLDGLNIGESTEISLDDGSILTITKVQEVEGVTIYQFTDENGESYITDGSGKQYEDIDAYYEAQGYKKNAYAYGKNGQRMKFNGKSIDSLSTEKTASYFGADRDLFSKDGQTFVLIDNQMIPKEYLDKALENNTFLSPDEYINEALTKYAEKNTTASPQKITRTKQNIDTAWATANSITWTSDKTAQKDAFEEYVQSVGGIKRLDESLEWTYTDSNGVDITVYREGEVLVYNGVDKNGNPVKPQYSFDDGKTKWDTPEQALSNLRAGVNIASKEQFTAQEFLDKTQAPIQLYEDTDIYVSETGAYYAQYKGKLYRIPDEANQLLDAQREDFKNALDKMETANASNKPQTYSITKANGYSIGWNVGVDGKIDTITIKDINGQVHTYSGDAADSQLNEALQKALGEEWINQFSITDSGNAIDAAQRISWIQSLGIQFKDGEYYYNGEKFTDPNDLAEKINAQLEGSGMSVKGAELSTLQLTLQTPDIQVETNALMGTLNNNVSEAATNIELSVDEVVRSNSELINALNLNTLAQQGVDNANIQMLQQYQRTNFESANEEFIKLEDMTLEGPTAWGAAWDTIKTRYNELANARQIVNDMANDPMAFFGWQFNTTDAAELTANTYAWNILTDEERQRLQYYGVNEELYNKGLYNATTVGQKDLYTQWQNLNKLGYNFNWFLQNADTWLNTETIDWNKFSLEQLQQISAQTYNKMSSAQQQALQTALSKKLGTIETDQVRRESHTTSSSTYGPRGPGTSLPGSGTSYTTFTDYHTVRYFPGQTPPTRQENEGSKLLSNVINRYNEPQQYTGKELLELAGYKGGSVSIYYDWLKQQGLDDDVIYTTLAEMAKAGGQDLEAQFYEKIQGRSYDVLNQEEQQFIQKHIEELKQLNLINDDYVDVEKNAAKNREQTRDAYLKSDENTRFSNLLEEIIVDTYHANNDSATNDTVKAYLQTIEEALTLEDLPSIWEDFDYIDKLINTWIFKMREYGVEPPEINYADLFSERLSFDSDYLNQLYIDIDDMPSEGGDVLTNWINQTLNTDTGAEELSQLLGSDIGKGVLTGMLKEQGATQEEAEKFITNIETALSKAAQQGSPAARFFPLGRDIAAGIAVGMIQYLFGDEAAQAITNLEGSLADAVKDNPFLSALLGGSLGGTFDVRTEGSEPTTSANNNKDIINTMTDATNAIGAEVANLDNDRVKATWLANTELKATIHGDWWLGDFLTDGKTGTITTVGPNGMGGNTHYASQAERMENGGIRLSFTPYDENWQLLTEQQRVIEIGGDTTQLLEEYQNIDLAPLYASLQIGNENQFKAAVQSALARIAADLDVELTVNVATIGGGENEETPTGGGQAKGNVALAKGTLMGELGPELYVTGGHYYVAGQNGAEFVDLPDDAIVFNHLQTKRLMNNGSTGRGSAVTNEKKATSYAKGNLAMASASDTLNQLKNLRAMWQKIADLSTKDLATKGGGGGGGSEGISLHDLQLWYNLEKQIAWAEKEITYQQKLRQNMRKGDDYVKSLEYELSLLEKQADEVKWLTDLQSSYYKKQVERIQSGIFGKFYSFTEDGLIQYQDNAFNDMLMRITQRDEKGTAKYDNKQQRNMVTSFLVGQGYSKSQIENWFGIKEDGTKVKDDAEWLDNMWDKIDAAREEMEDLNDSVKENREKYEDLIAAQNKILQEYVDLQLSLEQQLLKAIEDREQAVIDKLQENHDAIKESSDKYIEGLSDALDKERSMYDRNQEDAELAKMQRRLAILQRSGGSASEILSLQNQINSQMQDRYFNAQQEQIDAIQDASDKQLEKLQQQIDIAKETLEYQKEHGLLWAEVTSIMQNWTPNQMADFVKRNTKDWLAKSPADVEETMKTTLMDFEKWYAHLQLTGKFNTFYDNEMTAANLKNNYGINTDDENMLHLARSTAKEAYQRYYTDEEFASKYDSAEEAARDALRKSTALHPSKPGDFNYEMSSGGSSGGSGSGGGYTSFEQVKEAWNAALTKFNAKEPTPKSFSEWFDSARRWGVSYDTYSRALANKTDWALSMKSAAEAEYASYKKALTDSYKKDKDAAYAELKRIYNGYPVAVKNLGLKLPSYDVGGMVEKTGIALVHAKEGVLPPEQVEQLRKLTLANSRDSLSYQLTQLSDALEIVAPAIADNLHDNSIVIENATVEMHVDSIANDYDARRAGEQALEKMLSIARKSSVQSFRR